jgi:hypothetical protein
MRFTITKNDAVMMLRVPIEFKRQLHIMAKKRQVSASEYVRLCVRAEQNGELILEWKEPELRKVVT